VIRFYLLSMLHYGFGVTFTQNDHNALQPSAKASAAILESLRTPHASRQRW
jgi:hypothetical protein